MPFVPLCTEQVVCLAVRLPALRWLDAKIDDDCYLDEVSAGSRHHFELNCDVQLEQTIPQRMETLELKASGGAWG